MKAVGVSTLVDCYRFRGDVLDLRRDWHGAQVWYAIAVTLGPDIPSGYFSWGARPTRRSRRRRREIRRSRQNCAELGTPPSQMR
jgi:hypothetical protein